MKNEEKDDFILAAFLIWFAMLVLTPAVFVLRNWLIEGQGLGPFVYVYLTALVCIHFLVVFIGIVWTLGRMMIK